MIGCCRKIHFFGGRKTVVNMATIHSVDGQTIWYILDDITRYLGDYRNILAVIGIFYIYFNIY